MFVEKLAQNLNNISITENGALSYKTTGKELLDFNFKLPSYRGDIEKCLEDFQKIIESKDPYILKYLYYMRDVREGLGERKTFRNCLQELIEHLHETYSENDFYDIMSVILLSIPEYGRWDDLLVLLDLPETCELTLLLIQAQLIKDLENSASNNPISLLAKWLPSDNATSILSRKRAGIIKRFCNLSTKEYRNILKKLRTYLDVLEVKTCSNRWDEINYNTVPSNANIRYKDAFMRHDSERRLAYLDSLSKGDSNVKINGKVNFAHDIVAAYNKSKGYYSYYEEDPTLEALWKELPELEGLDNTLVIRDGSGSMYCRIPESNTVQAIDVANAICLYCSPRCKGEFKNKFITFSNTPKLVDLTNHDAHLKDMLEYVRKYSDCSNTNLERVFKLILNTAVTNNMKQEDLPKQLLIVSDMEFDQGVDYNSRLFDSIKKEYENAGYKLPKLVFWNVNSRTNAIPVTQNENGVILVSGFSLMVINLINNGETDPYKALIKELSKDRYLNIPLLKF